MKKPPLSDVIVLDLTRAVSGPYCTMLLKNLGATIIKVERPDVGDDTRGLGPFQNGVSTYNAIFNHGKKSIALDFKKPEDQEILESLISRADVLVENFRPGVMEHLGFGWERLHQAYPKLIYAAISGYGLTGPIANHACYDLVAQGISGLMSLTGHPKEKPTKVGTELADVLAGIFGAFAINTALYHREKTGKGTLADIAMLDCMLSLLYSAVNNYTSTREVPKRMGNRHPTAVPFDTFPTKDEPINIAVANDSLFKKLCVVLENTGLAEDERFSTIPARTKNRVELTEIITKILENKPAAEWVDACIKMGVPAGRIYELQNTLNFPQLKHRNMVVGFEEGYLDGVNFPGMPIKLSCLDEKTVYEPAPVLDENRTEILNFIKTGRF